MATCGQDMTPKTGYAALQLMDIRSRDQEDQGSMGSVSLIRTAANDPQYAARVILADQNQDGEINVADVLLLQRRLLSGERYPPQAALEPVAPGTAGGMERQTSFAALIDYLIHPAHAVPGDPGQLLYVHVDHLGTPVAMTDEQGVKVWSAVYDPFGKATPNEDPDGNGQAVTLNVRFAGQYYDQETGLHYNYFRYYDPGTGRYLTSDPVGLDGGINTYSYVGGNPLSYIDKTGLYREWDGQGDTSICEYYEKLKKENPKCNYLPEAENICRGGNNTVNRIIRQGIRWSWYVGGTGYDQSTVLNHIRRRLIDEDIKRRNGGSADPNGCTCGDDIDQYHYDIFEEAGIPSPFYGGYWAPQDTLGNPVPYDPRGFNPIDDLFN